MGNDTYDVIVIGAGPGGAACAGLLAKDGMKVLLVEKNDRSGGKTMTVSKDGFTYELWPVTINPIHDSRYEALIQELGLDVELLDPTPGPMFYYRVPGGKFEPYEMPGPVPMTEEETKGFEELLTDMMTLTPEVIETMDAVTFHEFLSRYHLSSSIYSFWAQVANITFLEPVDLVPVSEMLKTMNGITAGGGSGYIKGGFGRLAEACADAVKKNGGTVALKAGVERISIKDGQVCGVVTQKGEFSAPIVVSNAGIQPTVLKLVGEEHFDKSYINYVKDLVPSFGLMGYRYFMNKPVLDHPLYITFSDEGYWNVERSIKAKAGQVLGDGLIHLVIPSVFDPSLAPEGKQLVLASIMCPPDPEMENPQVWWDQLDETIAEIWPEFREHIEYKETFSIANISAATRDHVLPGQGGECIGLGQIVGQCGQTKPSAGAPVRGLFYVGADAGGYSCGTHQAVDSAFNVARQVLQYHQTH
jgi:phytoene dehydrogenase-like protein